MEVCGCVHVRVLVNTPAPLPETPAQALWCGGARVRSGGGGGGGRDVGREDGVLVGGGDTELQNSENRWEAPQNSPLHHPFRQTLPEVRLRFLRTSGPCCPPPFGHPRKTVELSKTPVGGVVSLDLAKGVRPPPLSSEGHIPQPHPTS